MQQFPNFCYNCHQPGHYATPFGDKSPGCENPVKCGFCAMPHATATCTLKDTHAPIDNHPQWKCPNCGLSHTAWSASCASPAVVNMRLALPTAGWGADVSRGHERVRKLMEPRPNPVALPAQEVISSTPPSTSAGPPTGTLTSPVIVRDTLAAQKAEWSNLPIMKRQAQPLLPPSTQPEKATGATPQWSHDVFHTLFRLYGTLPSDRQRTIDEFANTYMGPAAPSANSPTPRKRGRPPTSTRKRRANTAAASENPKKQRPSSPALPSALDVELSEDQASQLVNKCLALAEGLGIGAHPESADVGGDSTPVVLAMPKGEADAMSALTLVHEGLSTMVAGLTSLLNKPRVSET